MNKLLNNPDKEISQLLSILGQSARVQIVFIIAEQEACVCHLEALLDIRQARISQHLMALRKAGFVTTRRDGRHVYYRLAKPELIHFLLQAAEILQITTESLQKLSSRTETNCTCPRCKPELDAKTVCRPNSPIIKN
ncbi:MAG: ArsR family transcriptional regulator [Chloroflexi bacterium HGW-Chloroflexi-3]|nr:MAG: ArsR family transcriptional regulator [Chloroflexi bacterium HGW-Chloroflexi-3]